MILAAAKCSYTESDIQNCQYYKLINKLFNLHSDKINLIKLYINNLNHIKFTINYNNQEIRKGKRPKQTW